MRIVHTSDWHAGKIWKNISRLAELEAALASLARFVEEEAVDIVVVTGDVFDSTAPSADAERVVFQALKRIGMTGAQSVVIAGNHDAPARMEAWGSLTELVGVRVVARPTPADAGGVIELITKTQEKAVIAALPFAGVGQLVSASALAEDETRARASYADGVRAMVNSLCGRFRDDAVNILLAHTHIEGAVLAHSERAVHVGEQWAAMPQGLPSQAHYVALGHIHRPQQIEAAPAPTRYAGSPLQLDFGEVGDEKSFVVLDASAGRPARIQLMPYEGARPLLDVRATLTEIADHVQEWSGAWVRITVPIDRPDPDLGAKVKKLLANAVDVRRELPIAEGPPPQPSISTATSPLERYKAYHLARYQQGPEDAVLSAFEHLYADCSEDAEA